MMEGRDWYGRIRVGMTQAIPSEKVLAALIHPAQFTLFACVPDDRSALPQIPELDAIVVTDLYFDETCDQCGQKIWVGPRQAAARQLRPVHVTACFLCSMQIQLWDGLTPEEVNAMVVDLGGGSSIEGRPRD